MPHSLSRRFASHAEAMGAVDALEAAGFTLEEITLAESEGAERAGTAPVPGGAEVMVRVADQARLSQAADILERHGAGGAIHAQHATTAAFSGSSGTVEGHALSGTGPRPGSASDALPETTRADRDQAAAPPGVAEPER